MYMAVLLEHSIHLPNKDICNGSIDRLIVVESHYNIHTIHVHKSSTCQNKMLLQLEYSLTLPSFDIIGKSVHVHKSSTRI